MGSDEGESMTNDLSPHAIRELETLAQVKGPEQATAILTIHQRRDSGSCLCGWNELGKPHTKHQADQLRKAGLLKDLA